MAENVVIDYMKNKWFAALATVLVASFCVSGVMENTSLGNDPVDTRTAVDLRADQIGRMMDGVIAQPTQDNIGIAFRDLTDMGDWSYDNPNTQSVAFNEYLEACNDVRLSLKRGESKEILDKNIGIMYEKKSLI